MKEYLKMADVFDCELLIDCDFDDAIVDEQSFVVLESFDGSDVAKYAAHAINSHDELVAEIDRLSSSLNHANSNHELFERQYYLEKDKAERLQLEVEQLQQEAERLNCLILERTNEPGPY